MGGTDLGASHARQRLTLPAPFGMADVHALCERAERLLQEGHPSALECDVAAIEVPDLATVEGLARVELAARRHGSDILLRGASVELLELLALCGLSLELAPESEWEAEEREEASRVQEERDPGDPIP